MYTPGQQTPPLWLWKLARVQQGQETVSITPQLDLERYSRPCWPAFPVVSALYPCSLPRAQPRVESTGRGYGARIYIYIYIIGGGSENAFVIVLPTEARELVAVSAAAIPRGRGGGEGVLQASYNRMLCRFSKWLLDIIRIWIWTGGFVGLEGIPWDDDRFGGGGSPRVIGDYTRSTRVECFWICSRNVAIFVETFAWYYICNIFSMLMNKEYKRIYIPVEGKWMDLLNLFMIVVSFDLVDLIVNCLWKIW